MGFALIDPSELVMFKNLSTQALGITAMRESEKIELALTFGFRGIDLDIDEFHQRIQTSDLERASRLIRSAKIAFDEVDRRVENVALLLGCTHWGSFFRVSLPLARNGIVAGAIWGGFLKVWPVMIFLVPGLIGYALHQKGVDGFAIPC